MKAKAIKRFLAQPKVRVSLRVFFGFSEAMAVNGLSWKLTSTGHFDLNQILHTWAVPIIAALIFAHWFYECFLEQQTNPPPIAVWRASIMNEVQPDIVVAMRQHINSGDMDSAMKTLNASCEGFNPQRQTG
jgi:hypothetical protein